MAGPPSGVFVNLTFRFTGAMLPYGAVCTLGALNPPTDETIDGVISEFADMWQPLAANTCTLADCLVKYGPEATGPSRVKSVARVGSVSTPGSAPQVAVIVRKTVGGASGRFSGRMYLPGIPESAFSANGLMDAVAYNPLQIRLDALYDHMVDVDMAPVVFSAGSSDPRVVTKLVADARVGTQRRRNRR